MYTHIHTAIPLHIDFPFSLAPNPIFAARCEMEAEVAPSFTLTASTTTGATASATTSAQTAAADISAAVGVATAAGTHSHKSS